MPRRWTRSRSAFSACSCKLQRHDYRSYPLVFAIPPLRPCRRRRKRRGGGRTAALSGPGGSVSQRTLQNSGTREVRDAHRFDEQSLLDYLSTHLESFSGPFRISQFKGGQSNPTYLLEAASGRYVLRRKPPGKLLKSAHAVDREFRIISALYSVGFP
ncbi:MAG: phosphotransferase, partial [Woeseiaceae bacterium]|nr:phosphotransferase [Woeseiaceae bacterium]